MTMTDGWWRGRRVLVTGHTGFKGAWLCLMLDRLGAIVAGFSLPEAVTTTNLFSLTKIGETITHLTGDVRDRAGTAAAVARSDAEIIIHMAAQPLVRAGYADPIGTFEANVMGTVNLLDAVRTAGRSVRAAVVVTTDKCYENREWVWGYRETEPMGGHDPYSASKGCAELVTAAYRRSFFSTGNVAVATARAGNVIGGGDWAADRLVPDVVTAFAAGKPVSIRNPNSIRPWQLVLEPLTGYLALARHLVEHGQESADGWNFGPREADAKPVRWIVDRIAGEWGGDARAGVAPGDHPHEAHYLKLDTSKAAARLGYRPRTDLAIAVDWTVDWFKRWGAGHDPRATSLAQVDKFLSLTPPE